MSSFQDFDISKYIASLKGGDVGEVGKFAGGAIEEGFMPRYRRATEGVYSRGFGKRGSSLREGYRPVDRDFLSTLITKIPGMSATQQGLNLQSRGLDIQKALGERRMYYLEEEQHQKRRRDNQGWLARLFS